MRLLNRPVLLACLLFFIVLLPLGMIEGWYGRIDYSGDAIPYLDMARAVHSGDWKLAFNPLWGLGYPLLIASLKPAFAQAADGEWKLIHLLNLLIYAAAFAGFLLLIKWMIRAFERATRSAVDNAARSRVVLAGTAVFLSTELCLDGVSRVGPDLLVTTFILLALALLLRLIDTQSAASALLLGVTLGCGYVTKTIFLPLSVVILLIAAVCLIRRGRRMPILLLTLLAASAFALPYVAGLSWSMGRFTLGESGTLNYAWHVNRLPLMHWQGGPARFGRPMHPTTQLLDDPPIYAFAEPFRVTYPPFFNPPYYYEGYRHFFNAKLQARAVAANLLHLIQALRGLPIVYAVLLCVLIIYARSSTRHAWVKQVEKFWPILVPALAGTALYMQVHLEGRYLPAFLLLFALVPVTVFLVRAQAWPGYVPTLVLALLWTGSLATYALTNRSSLGHALHHASYSDSQPWVLARFLEHYGLLPGDAVAVVGGPATHCTWAYVDRLRIVAELSPDLYAAPSAAEQMFWGATASERARLLHIFAGTGAKLILAPDAPPTATSEGWQQVAGTNMALHLLR